MYATILIKWIIIIIIIISEGFQRLQYSCAIGIGRQASLNVIDKFHEIFKTILGLRPLHHVDYQVVGASWYPTTWSISSLTSM